MLKINQLIARSQTLRLDKYRDQRPLAYHRLANWKLALKATLLLAPIFIPLPVTAQISNIDIPFMSFYDWVV